jgi:CRP/FNR family cyclic AMP-dependent transcriptional regulator
MVRQHQLHGARPEGGEETFEPGTFLAALPDDLVDAVLSQGRRWVLPKGTTLVTGYDVPQRVLILLRGRVKVSRYTNDGREIILAIRGPGDVLGDLSAVDGGPPEGTVSAVDELEVLALGVERFETYVASDSRVNRAFLQSLSHRLRRTCREEAEQAANDTLGRVALRLLDLAQRYGVEDNGTVRIGLPLSQQQLAAWTGSSREAVSKALHVLRQRGTVETSRRQTVILDMLGLAAAVHRRVT